MKPTDPRHVPKRWLRNKVDATIYEWNEILAENPKCEEVHDAILFPRAYANIPSQLPEDTASEAPKKRGRPKKDLGLDEMLESQAPPAFTSDDFSTEVGRGWPK